EVRGFTEGNHSLGWLPNLKNPKHFYRDTPPYRLSANLFIDFPDLEKQGGYVSEIDLGNGKTKPASITDLSFGIDQNDKTMPHHIDFWLDDFDGKQVIDYDLYTIKSDTESSDYHDFLPPDLQGFTPKNPGGRGSEFKEEDDLDDLNDKREDVTPFPEVYSKELDENGDPKQKGKLYFMRNFPNDDKEFTENGYLKFEYSRNKYSLRFNYDPTIIRDESYFNANNSLDTFYEFPLKALSPYADTEGSYKTENPKNILDNPEKLKELGLKDLVFTDPKDGKLKVKRPKGLSDQMVFKGWALDPAGTKLVRDNGSEKMPSHPVNLYAKWGEPDYKWKVTFDPNGGFLRNIKEEKLTKSRKKIQEGDIGQEDTKTYPIKEESVGDKQIFTVLQRQKLVEPDFKPTRKGYDFLGWEVIRYKKNQKGDYTDEIDDSYRKTYKVPELYSFGNDVVAPVYLKAIWVPNHRVDVKAEHYFLDKDFNLDKSIHQNPDEDTLEEKRAKYLVASTGDRQDEKYILVTNKELEDHKDTSDVYGIYKEYNDRVKLDNAFFQTFEVEPAQILNTVTNKLEDNPKVANNVFKFFYKPYRQREYKVNYVDERAKAELAKATSDEDRKAIIEKYSIVDQEAVTNGNRYYDARNYRPIPGWVLAKDEKPQQQLFFDVEDKTNKFLGINGTGKDEITFYYKDVRIIEVPKDAPVPDGYVRVTFKADKGGSFGKDDKGNDITELNYDVIKGLKSDLLPVPKELAEGETVDKDKYYITPETGKKFVKWDNKPLLNKDTIINEDHTSTAYFEWSGLSASGLVRTEALKDPENKWTNNFAPTIDQLKAQLVWREKDQVKDLPAGTEIKLYDEAGNELTKDDQVYDLVNEKNKADKDELVRKVNIKAKVTFKDGKDPQELDIPITVYKNVYEALNKDGDKPLFLKEAEGKEAKDGGLKDVTGNYVKVTVKASKDFNDKDDKIYYVNKNAWVEIPEVKTDGSSTFTNWTADKDAQKENGIFDFGKRHKFTEDTVISPIESNDVVEVEKGKEKPDLPKTYVKVIVKTTDKATDQTAFEKTFWVNPTKEVTIPVTDPTGKTDQDVTIPIFGRKKASYDFKKWQIVQTGEADDKLQKVEPTKIDLAKHRYTDKVTVIEASYSQKIAWFDILKPTETKELHTPQGKEITNDDLIKQITPQKDKVIESIEVISKPDGKTVGNEPAKVIIKYKDGTSQGTKDNPIVIPVKVHEPILEAGPKGQKPEEALDNYVKVIFKAGTDGKLGNTLSGSFTYYVSPEVEVDMTELAVKITKIPDVGYISGDWDTSETKKLKDKFTAEETEFTFNFTKTEDIVEKTDDNIKKPDGYVKVSFITKDESKGKLEGDKLEKIYYVNPKADIKLVELADVQKANDKQLAVPKTKPSANYVFDRWYEDINTKDSITSERKYEARFKLAKLSLTYDAGGASGTVPDPSKVSYGKKVGLKRAENLTKDHSVFAGWKIGDKIYQAGDEITLKENTTATAQWKPVEHTVTFDSKGGTKLDDQKVKHNDKLKAFTEPKQEGKVFMGWKENENDKNFFNLNTPITEDKNLVAIWQESVQEIKDGDKIEDKFIKVSFKKGNHGKLDQGEKTYKIAKNYSFEKAKEKGMEVPTIKADKYYKAKDGESAWDKELALNGQSIEFIAQYELIGDVIPVDKADRDDNEIKKEQPEGTVLVEYKVADTDKAYLDGAYKFFVKKGKEVTIRSPLFVKTDKDYDFKGWTSGNPDDQANEGEKNKWEQVAKKDGEEKVYIRGIFVKDEIIINQNEDKPFIEIFKANAGDKYVEINELSEGAEGRLSIVRSDEDGNEVETPYESSTKTFKVRRRRKIVTIEKKVFDFKGDSLQSGDIIRFKAVKVKDGEITSESDVTEIVID
ncbi:InlB B-repeat-containing protein, partial [Anaerococcus tetradius]|uniref:InlB B-repeat-containing protein n=1 Tax=Anaerococcus tetradius TaxID=33036 RepID=UPI0023F3C40D